MNRRFTEEREGIHDFTDEFLVVCPGCRGCARVLHRVPGRAGRFDPRRLVCPACGRTTDWEGNGLCRGTDGRDWYFGLPLWLRARCRGEVLWTYNARHLRRLEECVGTQLRENVRDPEYGWCNKSFANRLPRGVQDAKNREKVLKAIARLRRTLPRAGGGEAQDGAGDPPSARRDSSRGVPTARPGGQLPSRSREDRDPHPGDAARGTREARGWKS